MTPRFQFVRATLTPERAKKRNAPVGVHFFTCRVFRLRIVSILFYSLPVPTPVNYLSGFFTVVKATLRILQKKQTAARQSLIGISQDPLASFLHRISSESQGLAGTADF
jgi:hypothetical protein